MILETEQALFFVRSLFEVDILVRDSLTTQGSSKMKSAVK